jgi:hypothetical protein
MSTTSIPRGALAAALAAQSHLCGADVERSLAVPRALAWLRTCWEAGQDHLPYVLVHDLGHMLLFGRDFRFASGRQLEGWPEDERSLRLSYEDKVLGLWALDPSVCEVHVAVAGMPDELRDAAVAHALGLALSGPLLGSSVLARGNPAHLREQLFPLHQHLLELEEPDPDWLAWAHTQLEELQSLLRGRSGRLFGDEDVWEVVHLAELGSESARLSLREIHEAVRHIGALPVGDQGVLRSSLQQVPVEDTDADTYPTGGFDALSTRGTTENLVRSEIVYVGESTGSAHIDLFDLRYLEGELLYYTRDESPLLDALRTLSITIDRPASLRYKHARLPAQTLVLVQALALVLQQDLVRVFGPMAARVHLGWRVSTPADLKVAEEERALLALSLGAELAHQRCTLEVSFEEDEPPSRGRVIFSPLAMPSRFEGAWIRVDGERWRTGDRQVDASSWGELRSLATALLARAG